MRSPRLLVFSDDGESFAPGAVEFSIGARGTPAEGRLLLKIQVEGQATIAVIDTGSPYLICEPDLAEFLEPYLTDFAGSASLTIRGVSCQGDLYRLSIEIVAQEGMDCRLEATAFIPRLSLGQVWNLPSFIGWTGMLERLRFALDPNTDTFYFGPLA